MSVRTSSKEIRKSFPVISERLSLSKVDPQRQPFPREHFIKWTVCLFTGLRVEACVEGQGLRIDALEGAIGADGSAGGVHEGVGLTEEFPPMSAGRKNSTVMFASDLAV